MTQRGIHEDSDLEGAQEAYHLIKGMFNKLVPERNTYIKTPLVGHQASLRQLVMNTTKPAILNHLDCYESDDEEGKEEEQQELDPYADKQPGPIPKGKSRVLASQDYDSEAVEQ